MCTKFWSENMKRRDHSENLEVDGRMDVKEIGWKVLDCVRLKMDLA